MADEFSFDVFLSHSSRDKDVIRELAERLQRDGLRVWFDQWEIQPGDSIPSKIEEGLEHSRVHVLCMAAHAFGFDWSQLESGKFRLRDPLNREPPHLGSVRHNVTSRLPRDGWFQGMPPCWRRSSNSQG